MIGHINIRILIILLLMVTEMSYTVEKPPFNVNPSRLILTKLRNGDYAHVGDEEANDMVIQAALQYEPDIKVKPTLDLGCGFGGTAHYFHQKGFCNIQGVDLDNSSVDYAKHKYPTIPFFQADALEIDNVFAPGTFSFIILMNVAYAIKDKTKLFQKLSLLSKKGGLLIIFDYSTGNNGNLVPVTDLANKPMYPIQTDTIQNILYETGWEILNMTDITTLYIGWYYKLLKNLISQEQELAKEFSTTDIKKVKDTFTFLHDQLVSTNMGGTIILAKKWVN